MTATACGSGLLLPMVATDWAFLDRLAEELLDPVVIRRTIEKAIAELQRDETGASATAEGLRRELAAIQVQLARLSKQSFARRQCRAACGRHAAP